MEKVKSWIKIGTVLNGCAAAAGAWVAAVETALTIWGILYARKPIANDYMALGAIIAKGLAMLFLALAPFMAALAVTVFALSLLSYLLGKASLKKHQSLPYSRKDLKNTAGRMLCNGLMAFGCCLMLCLIGFRSFLLIGMLSGQIVICVLQAREICEIRKMP